jgi:hypothetical protein
MRYARRLSFSKQWLPAALPLCAALALGCHGKVGDVGGGAGIGVGGAGGTGTPATPCAGPSDPRMVVAQQRVLLLTSREIINTIRYLIDDTIATNLVTSQMFTVTSDIARTFPPADGEMLQSIPDRQSLTPLDLIAQTVAQYVYDNFAAVTKCTTATDACAQAWLEGLAQKAYRRKLTDAELARFRALYTKLKNHDINCYQVTASVQQATQYSVYALLISPQLLWRWEIGNTAAPSTSPPGFYLTDGELASQLSFFLTDNPPDQMLIDAAAAGTLRTNLASHVSRILATQQSKDWLRTIMETFYLINQLPDMINTIDPDKFPIISNALLADMQTESRKFLDHAMWGSGSKLTDFLTSRTAFLNTGLATNIYKVPAPAGATATNFAQTTLPDTQRSGIITNAGFITARARSDRGGVVPRGRAIKAAFLCLITPPPPDEINQPGGAVDQARMKLGMQTVQEQVAFRAMIPLCKDCHASFDPYGLVLDYYDNIGIYRTTDDLGGTVDAHTSLPAELGGATVTSAIDLAKKLSESPTFANCMATSVLQYAMVSLSSPVELPLAPTKAGCAASDVVTKFNATSGKSFTDLVNAVTSAPAFVVRGQAP